MMVATQKIVRERDILESKMSISGSKMRPNNELCV